MKKLKIYTDGKAVTALKQLLLLISLMFIFLPAIASRSSLTAAPAIWKMWHTMFLSGFTLLVFLGLWVWLLSRYSPVKWLRIRKRLILFTRMFLHSEEDGLLLHSVWWEYSVKNGKVTVILYPNGLEKDTADIGRKLSEYLRSPLFSYEESDGRVTYVFDRPPERINAIEKMTEGITEPMGRYVPVLSYEPVPIYDSVIWDFTSEALHVLLIAPSGAGKTRLLTYLGGMVLKRQHRLYVIDAKNSDFGMIFRDAGVPVATEIGEIIQVLTELVQEMEKRYSILYQTDDAEGLDFREKGMPGHFLIFDEILSVLFYADKKDKAEIERLLGQIALKGRAAGFSIIITAQKLNATDLPKAITEQCQTRIILGKIVSEETFHQATGMYKKDIGTVYRGGKGKGYAVTPETGELSYIKTPLLPGRLGNYRELLKNLKERGTNPYEKGR